MPKNGQSPTKDKNRHYFYEQIRNKILKNRFKKSPDLRFKKIQRRIDRKNALLENAIKNRRHRAQKISLLASSIFL